MTREFIFDSAGLVIGYRCRVMLPQEWKIGDPEPPRKACNVRPFNTARGLWQHQRRAHGLYQQLQLISTPETANISRGKKK